MTNFKRAACVSEQILIGLGTNQGDRWSNLTRAIEALERQVRVELASPVYETQPWGPVPQPDFLNLGLSAWTTLAPEMLLTICQRIESDLGRQPSARWGPRLIDLDLLFMGRRILNTPGLTLPHPHVRERAFVLLPLAEIAPDFIDPVTGRRVAELARRVDATTVRRWSQAIPIWAGV